MTKKRILGVALALLFGGAAPVASQSLYNAAGLGVPIDAVDGRARSLGNLGIGLRGGAIMPTDPAALGRLVASTGVMAAQPSWVDYTVDPDDAGSFQGTRFPLVGIAYPLFGGMMSIQIGSVLDQRYEVVSPGEVDFGQGPVATTDEFDQDGSISNLNLGFARRFGSRISGGLTLGRYSGSVLRTLTRTYGDEDSSNVDSYEEQGEWSYRAFSVTAGASADVGRSGRVAVSLQIPTTLEAEASRDTRGGDRRYGLPIQIMAGASVGLGQALTLSGSFRHADWGVMQHDLQGTSVAHASNGFGVGLELTRARLFGKAAPLRFGFREVGLPFSFEAEGASERIVSGGVGLDLSRSGELVLASVDLAVERGWRKSPGLTENFWRATVSLRASGL